MSCVAWSAKKGHLEIVKYLVKNGADGSVGDRNRIDPLEHAAKSGHLETVKWLVEREADTKHVDRFGMSALAWAAKAGHLDVVQYLVEQGADAQQTDKYGLSAAQLAANKNHWKVAKWLLVHGQADAGDLIERALCGNQWREVEEMVSLTPDGAVSASGALKANGKWADRVVKAGKWELFARLVAKGADPGGYAQQLLRMVVEKETVMRKRNAKTKKHKRNESNNYDLYGKLTLEKEEEDRVEDTSRKENKKYTFEKENSRGKSNIEISQQEVENEKLRTEIKNEMQESDSDIKYRNTKEEEEDREEMEGNGEEICGWKEYRKDGNGRKDGEGGARTGGCTTVDNSESEGKGDEPRVEGDKKEESSGEGKKGNNEERRKDEENSEGVKYKETDNEKRMRASELVTLIPESMGFDKKDKRKTCDEYIENQKHSDEKKKCEEVDVFGTKVSTGEEECRRTVREGEIIRIKEGKSNDQNGDRQNREDVKGKAVGDTWKQIENGKSGLTERKINIDVLEYPLYDKKKDAMPEERTKSLKTKLDRLLQLGNAKLFDSFILSLNPEDYRSLEETLAEVNQDLATKRIPLAGELKENVETKLIQSRLFSEKNPSTEYKGDEMSLEDVKVCINMILKAIQTIETNYWANEEIDCVFLHITISIAKYVHVLKRFLRPTFAEIPWNEIEFCLISFLSSILKPNEADEISVLILDKSTIVNHLMNFSKKLLEVKNNLKMKDVKTVLKLSRRNAMVKKIIAQNPEFETLYNDYDIVKNIYSLKKIDSIIQLAISVDPKEKDELGKIVIERTLQVLGEYLKNAPDSPNVSDDVHNILLESAPRHAKNIVTSLRDTLSHADSLTRKVELETNKDSQFFELVQNDLKKMGTETLSILYKKKVDAFKEFLKKVLHCGSSDEMYKLTKRLKDFHLETDNYYLFRYKELEKLSKLVAELKSEYGEKYSESDTLFDKIDEIIQLEESRLMQTREDYAHYLSISNFLFNSSMNMQSQKNSAETLLKVFESKDSKLKEIGKLIEDFARKKIDDHSIKMKYMFYKIFSIIKFEINRIEGIDDIKDHLIEQGNEEEVIKKTLWEIFSTIERKLESKEDKEIFMKEIGVKIKIHEARNKLIHFFSKKDRLSKNVDEDDINFVELFSDLNFGGKKADDLRKNYNEKKYDNCLPLVKNINDDYEKLIKNFSEMSVFSVKKYIEALRKFFFNCKKLKSTVNNAIDEIEKEKIKEVAEFYNQRVNLLKKILECKDDVKEKNIAMEMLLLEITEVLEHASLLADNKFYLLEDSPVLVGKALRNYLAHGDPLVDLLPYDPTTSILVHARALVNQGSDLITKSRVMGRPSKPVNFEDVSKLDSARTLMASLQDGLFQASKRGDLTGIRDLVTKGADLRCRTVNGLTSLQISINSDDIDTLKYFVEQGLHLDMNYTLQSAVLNGSVNIIKHLCKKYFLNLNTKYFREAKLIKHASQEGQKEVLEYLLSFGVDVEILEEDPSPLMYAVNGGHREIVELILQHMKSLNCTSRLDKALTMATYGCHPDIVRILLNHGIDTVVEIKRNWTPLHVASMFGQNQTILEFISSGASVDAKDHEGKTPLYNAVIECQEEAAMILLSHGANIEFDSPFDMTMLHMAAESGLSKVVELLLDKGLPVNAQTSDGWTALHYAARNAHLGVARVLLTRGADVHVRTKDTGSTALCFAAASGATEMVREIVERYPDAVNSQDDQGFTPLIIASDLRQVDVVQVLIGAGADVHATEAEQRTSLHRAARGGSEDVSAILLEHGANINALDINNATPLYMSIMNKHTGVSKLLIEKGAEIGVNAVNGISMLYLASGIGCAETVRTLIKKGAEVDGPGFGFYLSPLHAAAERGHKDIVIALLDAGARADIQDGGGSTPLFIAVNRGGHNDVVEVLASRCPRAVNLLDKRTSLTPLGAAVMNGYDDVVGTLLKYGADANAYQGFGPLLVNAALNGRKNAVELLLKHGALVNGPVTYDDSDDWDPSPILAAVEGDRLEVVKILLDHGADINISPFGLPPLLNACTLRHEDLAVYLVERGANFDIRNRNGATPLHIAAEAGMVRLARALLERGADPRESAQDLTPLLLALKWGYEPIVRLLLDHEENAEVRMAEAQSLLTEAAARGFMDIVGTLLKVPGVSVDAHGDSPGCNAALHTAALYGHLEMIEFLLDEGANIEVRNDADFTPLHVAAREGRADAVVALLHRGADVSARARGPKEMNPLGATALHLAVQENRPEVTKILLENGADANATDFSDCAPLHIVSGEECAQLLLENNAFIEIRDIQGHTPLHVCCMGGRTGVVTQLLDRGADINARNYEGRAPLHMAAYNGHTDIILLLLNKQVELEPRDVNMWTPIHFSAFHGHPGAIELLAASGACVDARELDGATPLLMTSEGMAEASSKAETARALLTAGANPDLHDAEGLSPLLSAFYKANVELVSVLLQGGADANIPQADGAPLYLAAMLRTVLTNDDEVRDQYDTIAHLLFSVSE